MTLDFSTDKFTLLRLPIVDYKKSAAHHSNVRHFCLLIFSSRRTRCKGNPTAQRQG